VIPWLTSHAPNFGPAMLVRSSTTDSLALRSLTCCELAVVPPRVQGRVTVRCANKRRVLLPPAASVTSDGCDEDVCLAPKSHLFRFILTPAKAAPCRAPKCWPPCRLPRRASLKFKDKGGYYASSWMRLISAPTSSSGKPSSPSPPLSPWPSLAPCLASLHWFSSS
jgi:hypothetical protein